MQEWLGKIVLNLRKTLVLFEYVDYMFIDVDCFFSGNHWNSEQIQDSEEAQVNLSDQTVMDNATNRCKLKLSSLTL